MKRRVIELQNGQVVRDVPEGMYRREPETTAEFGALMRGEDHLF
jgi:hypothetical protein